MQPHNDAPRQRKIDKEKLRAHVDANPDMYLRERAVHFGVGISALHKAMRKLGFCKKKSGAI